MADIVGDQIDYYRARANEYDEWFFRRGRYDQGVAHTEKWNAQVAEVEAALFAARPRGQALEIACGTGLWTRHLAPRVARLTALDAVAETLKIAEARVGAANVDYVEADIFSWQPPRAYDFIFFGFWISHIPTERWDDFWDMVGRAAAPGGGLFFVDNRRYYSPEIRNVRRAGEDEIEDRDLNDGRRYSIVKNFFVPAQLSAELSARGWHGTVRETADFFLYGSLERASSG